MLWLVASLLKVLVEGEYCSVCSWRHCFLCSWKYCSRCLMEGSTAPCVLWSISSSVPGVLLQVSFLILAGRCCNTLWDIRWSIDVSRVHSIQYSACGVPSQAHSLFLHPLQEGRTSEIHAIASGSGAAASERLAWSSHVVVGYINHGWPLVYTAHVYICLVRFAM